MKTIFIALFIAVLAISAVSAKATSDFSASCYNWYCSNEEKTIIGGTITDATNGNAPADGADVTVTCNENSLGATADSSGHYTVEFDGTECGQNDVVYVEALKGSLSGSNEDVVDDGEYVIGGVQGLCGSVVNIGLVDVPLIPEFGFIAGSLTIAGALIALFVIRKR